MPNRMVAKMTFFNQSNFASLSGLPGRLTIVPQVFPNEEGFHVESIEDENCGKAEQKRDEEDLMLSMIGRIYEI